ncbi:MAG: hypothetical protein PF450_14320 [Bacteroidales bacterium]|nr:hypothetical protein [Bacteroidales bacterium]
MTKPKGKKPELFNWLGKRMSAKRILELHLEENPNTALTLATFRARLKKTKGDVEASFNYKRIVTKEITTFDCPDGVTRTHSEIVKYFGCNRSTWSTRFNRSKNLKEAWNEQIRVGTTDKPVVTKFVPKVSKETKRQQAALAALPSATAYENNGYRFKVIRKGEI